MSRRDRGWAAIPTDVLRVGASPARRLLEDRLLPVDLRIRGLADLRLARGLEVRCLVEVREHLLESVERTLRRLIRTARWNAGSTGRVIIFTPGPEPAYS